MDFHHLLCVNVSWTQQVAIALLTFPGEKTPDLRVGVGSGGTILAFTFH